MDISYEIKELKYPYYVFYIKKKDSSYYIKINLNNFPNYIFPQTIEYFQELHYTVTTINKDEYLFYKHHLNNKVNEAYSFKKLLNIYSNNLNNKETKINKIDDISIGDIFLIDKELVKNKNNNKIDFFWKYGVKYRLTTQTEYDRYMYKKNKHSCNGKFYHFMMKLILEGDENNSEYTDVFN